MGHVQAGDVKLYYEVHGSGEPLLMIMGLGSSSATWSPTLVSELSRRFQTIVYDNRGTGQSDKPAIPYSLEMFAGDAIAWKVATLKTVTEEVPRGTGRRGFRQPDRTAGR
jgi:3-oxoadipate enol-lactonase